MNPTTFYQKIQECFEVQQDQSQSGQMKAYMKNQFEFYGIKSPRRKELLKGFIRKNDLPEGAALQKSIELMWNDPYREMQYAAMDIMAKKIRTMDLSFLDFFEKLILQKSWWDTVDWLAPNGCGKLFQKYPAVKLSYTDRWNQSDNIWLQRSSILFQLKYRHETDVELLKKYILHRATSKEFFVQKAAGWALRQYGKYKPSVVIDFIENHKTKLAPLTMREGLKHLKN